MKRYSFCSLAATIFISSILAFSAALAGDMANYGHFEGKLHLEAISGSNKMKLLEPYTYIDPKGKRWVAPMGYESDGASIPRVAWTLVGDPWGAYYRDAAVIHDVACDTRTEKWEDVHMAFYQAMLATGLQHSKAKLMYAAVYHFGPRWTRSAHGTQRKSMPRPTKQKLEQLKAKVNQIESTKTSEESQLEDIRNIDI